jgi:hypothetical protein
LPRCYELFEKRFLKWKRLFATAKEPALERPAAVSGATRTAATPTNVAEDLAPVVPTPNGAR